MVDRIEDTWGAFGLTATDDKLLSSSSRDPLGLEVIWTAFGARVVPRLSTVSRGVCSFAAHLAHTWIVEEYLSARPGLELEVNGPLKPLMVRCLECVHALSVASRGGGALERRNLPGIATATRRLAGDAEVSVGLDPRHDLLVGQAGMGIGGRYRRPLMDGEAGALLRDDDTLNREGAYGDELVGLLEAEFTPLHDAAHALLDALCKAGSAEHALAFTKVPDAMIEASAGLRRAGRPENADLAMLIARAFGLEPGSTSLQRRLLDAAEANQTHGSPTLFAALSSQDLGEAERARVEDVRMLEEVLWRLDLTFDQLWRRTVMPAHVDETFTQLLGRADDLHGLATLSEGTAKARLSELYDLLVSSTDALTFARALANTYHARVARNRSGGTPWVVVSERPGGLEVQIIAGNHDPALERTGWRRAYYVPTLREFGVDLRRLTATPEGDDG
jgi:hypothetical protein